MAGLCKCMLCTHPKGSEEKIHLLAIEGSLDKLNKRLDNIEKWVQIFNILWTKLNTRLEKKKRNANVQFHKIWNHNNNNNNHNRLLTTNRVTTIRYARNRKYEFNPFMPKDFYSGRTAPLTSKRWILYIYSTNTDTEHFKYGIYCPFLSLQNAICSIILTHLVPVLFTFYIQGELKFKKIIPAPKD